MKVFFLLQKIKGGYQIEWVAISICKRKDYSESRKKNRSGKHKNISESYVQHMEIENENVNKDINVNVLTENEILNSIEYIKRTIYLTFSEFQVLDLWKGFIIENEKTFYKNRDEKITHFRRWLKKQENGKSTTNSKSNGLGKKSGGFGILTEAIRQATGG